MTVVIDPDAELYDILRVGVVMFAEYILHCCLSMACMYFCSLAMMYIHIRCISLPECNRETLLPLAQERKIHQRNSSVIFCNVTRKF